MKGPAPPSYPTSQDNKTPFERFKEALGIVASVPKSSLPKTSPKKRRKK